MTGLLQQELGSFGYNNIYYKQDELLLSIFKEDNGSTRSLSNNEKDRLNNIVSQCNGYRLETDNDYIRLYNQSKHWITKNSTTGKMDKNQALAAMSRSLSIFFVIEIFRALLAYPNYSERECLWVLIFLVLISIWILCRRRYVRFTRMRYVTILREYLESQE